MANLIHCAKLKLIKNSFSSSCLSLNETKSETVNKKLPVVVPKLKVKRFKQITLICAY